MYVKLTNKSNGVVNVNATLNSFTHNGITHKNRSDRNGIQEKIWIEHIKYRINGGSWTSKGTTSNFDISTPGNAKVEVQCWYKLTTQGFHHKNNNLPFFFYSDQNGNVANYSGYKTNTNPPWPGYDSARSACCMPSYWTSWGGGTSGKSVKWTDWAKTHANTSDKLWWQSGPQHEQRHANYFGEYKDGWFSGQGRWNYYRRSCIWEWEYYDNVSITSSSASSTPSQPSPNPTPNPNPPINTMGDKPAAPTLLVHDAYGASGQVTITNNDSEYGYMKFGVWLKDGINGPNIDGTWRWIILGKQGVKVNNTWIAGSKWGPGAVHKVNLDFYEIFGEKYEGKQIYFQLSMENEAGVESDYYPSKGERHHFNAKPTIPEVTLKKEGNSLKGSWSSVDPDPRNYSTAAEPASLLTYDVNLEITSPSGAKRTESVATRTQSTSTTIAIKDSDEGASYVLKVRSHDGRIYSKDWGSSNKAVNGFKAVQPVIMYPIDESTVYNPTPRYVIRTEAKGSQDVLVVEFNGKTYKSNVDSSCFSSAYIPKGISYMIFRPSAGGKGKLNTTMYTENDSSKSATTTKVVKIESLDLSLSGGYIGAEDFINLEKHISNVSNAYGLNEYYTDGAYGYICAEDANVHMEHVYNIDYCIRRLNPALAPNISTTVKIPGVSYVSKSDYNGIVKDLKNM